jgi:hypothetical protein
MYSGMEALEALEALDVSDALQVLDVLHTSHTTFGFLFMVLNEIKTFSTTLKGTFVESTI